MKILVTDPEQRAALAAVRALARHGFQVYTAGERPGLAGVSRFVCQHLPLEAGVSERADSFRDALRAAVRQHDITVVIPVTDRASRALIGHDGELGTRIAGPSRAAYLAASDKAQVLDCAARCGLRVPFQVTVPSIGTAIPSIGHAQSVVVKPSNSVVEVAGRMVSTLVRYADGPEQLLEAVAKYPAGAYPLMIQERIIGEGQGVFLLRNSRRTLMQFAHRRIREKPPAGGVSTCRESMAPPHALVERCEALLDALDYEGAAMIEFKCDAQTGEHVLMEINARLWGSVQLAIDAGVDFPTALVRVTMGMPIESPAAPRTGVRSFWELGEVDHMWALISKSAEALHLPPGSSAGWRSAVRALFDHRMNDVPEVFRWNDWRPFRAELSGWLRGA